MMQGISCLTLADLVKRVPLSPPKHRGLFSVKKCPDCGRGIREVIDEEGERALIDVHSVDAYTLELSTMAYKKRVMFVPHVCVAAVEGPATSTTKEEIIMTKKVNTEKSEEPVVVTCVHAPVCRFIIFGDDGSCKAVHVCKHISGVPGIEISVEAKEDFEFTKGEQWDPGDEKKLRPKLKKKSSVITLDLSESGIANARKILAIAKQEKKLTDNEQAAIANTKNVFFKKMTDGMKEQIVELAKKYA